MNFSVYLIELLKTNDCVIIPDLGGFIANYHSAVTNPQGDQFYPPTKDLVFNGKLKKNDGLLVNFICERECVGYLEAREIVSEFVSECLFKLSNGERIEFEQIGSLHYDQNDHIIFEANSQFDFLRADAFGLGSFHFPHIVNKYIQPVKPVFRDKEPDSQSRRRPVVKYALLIIPILAALYFIPKIFLPDFSFKQPATNTASLAIIDSPVPAKTEILKSSPEVRTEPKLEVPFSSSEVREAVKLSDPSTVQNNALSTSAVKTPNVDQHEQAIAQTIINEPSNGKYHVVGGCFKVKENADKLAKNLIKQGFHSQVTNLGTNFYRVSVESFSTRKEAEQALVKLFEAEPDADYWLMADKK